MTRRRGPGNWVDRGQAPEPTLRRILSHYLQLPPDTAEQDLDHAATTVLGMVDADASEVQVAGWLRSLEEQLERPPTPPGMRRLAAIALWHAAKAARVRDAASAARRELAGRDGARDAGAPPLSSWLLDRLLSPEERRMHEAELARRRASGERA